MLDLLWLEAALHGDAAARGAGLSVVQGALVRCKRNGQYSWQQIRQASRQPDGSWDLLLVQEGPGASLKASWVSNAGVHTEEAGRDAELRELSARWSSLLSSRQQASGQQAKPVALTSWRLEGAQKLLAKILQRQGRAPDGSVPVNPNALQALVKTLQSVGGFRIRLGQVVGTAAVTEGGAAAVLAQQASRQAEQAQQQQGQAQPHLAQAAQLQHPTQPQVEQPLTEVQAAQQQQRAQVKAAHAQQQQQLQPEPPPPPQGPQGTQDYDPLSAASQLQQQQREVAPAQSGAPGVSTSEASVTVDGRQLPPMAVCPLAQPAKPSMLSSAGSLQRAGSKEAGAPTSAVVSDPAPVAAAPAATAAVTCSSAGAATLADMAGGEVQGAAADAAAVGEPPSNVLLANIDRLLAKVTKQNSREALLASAAQQGPNADPYAAGAAEGAAGAVQGGATGGPTAAEAGAGIIPAATRAPEAAVGSAVVDLSDSLASLPRPPASPRTAAVARPQSQLAAPEVAGCVPHSGCKWMLGQASQGEAADTAAAVLPSKAAKPELQPQGVGVLKQQRQLAAVTAMPGSPAATKSLPSSPQPLGSPGQANGSTRAGGAGLTCNIVSQMAAAAVDKGLPRSRQRSGGRNGSASRSRSRSDRKRRRRSLSRGSIPSRSRRRSRSSSRGRKHSRGRSSSSRGRRRSRGRSSSRSRDRRPVFGSRSPSPSPAAMRRLPRSVQNAIYDLEERLHGQLRARDFDDRVVGYMLKVLCEEEAMVPWVSHLQPFTGHLRNPAAWLMAQLKHAERAQTRAFY
ncbi:hypothetical protein N2152v2_001332 [Parachlorella kessleri]